VLVGTPANYAQKSTYYAMPHCLKRAPITLKNVPIMLKDLRGAHRSLM